MLDPAGWHPDLDLDPSSWVTFPCDGGRGTGPNVYASSACYSYLSISFKSKYASLSCWERGGWQWAKGPNSSDIICAFQLCGQGLCCEASSWQITCAALSVFFHLMIISNMLLFKIETVISGITDTLEMLKQIENKSDLLCSESKEIEYACRIWILQHQIWKYS